MAPPPPAIKKPILLIAQSGRFLAQSANQFHYPVWLADCFADADALAATQRYIKLTNCTDLNESEFVHIVETLTQKTPCQLIYSSGIEAFYPFLTSLPANIELVGNSLETLEKCCNPRYWFALLVKLNLPFPPTQFALPAPQDHSPFIFKQSHRWGGGHIMEARSAPPQLNGYFQRYTAGTSASALFLANGQRGQLLSINQQFVRQNQPADFTLQAIRNHFCLSVEQHISLQNILKTLIENLKLKGLNSLDFIIDQQGELEILELNPRPSASAQLLDPHWPIIEWHLQACKGEMPQLPALTSSEQRMLYFCFSDRESYLPQGFKWPAYCHDLPASDNHLKRGEILCSMLVETGTMTDAAALKLCQNLAQNLLNRLPSLS